MAAEITSQPIPRTRTAIRERGADLVFMIVLYLGLALILAFTLYPLIFVVSASFSDASAVMAGRVVLWPVDFSLKAYEKIASYQQIWVGFSNSLYYTVVGTLVNLAMTIMAAYPLSRKNFPGGRTIMLLFVFTMMFSGGLIPTYLTVNALKMIDTRWAVIVPQGLSVWNLLITVTYFRTSIPHELLEAAQLDGCSDFQYLGRVVLPLSAPIVAVLCLFYAVNHWNAYFDALIYLNNKDLFPLQIFLRDILVRSQIDMNIMFDIKTYASREAMRELLKYALIVVSSVPVLAIYPFVQKYFIKGMMIGAIKG